MNRVLIYLVLSDAVTSESGEPGELCGMLNALLWAKRQNGHETLAICYDSMYACNVTSGVWLLDATMLSAKRTKGAKAESYSFI